MESGIVMCRFKWNLWLLTVTCGSLLQVSSWNEVGANTILGSNSHVLHEIEAVKSSNGERGTKSKSKLGAGDVIGFAAEWEYKGSGLHELDDPSETKHPKNPSETQSTRIKPGIYPSRRIGPGIWLDSNGYWWLFGGQGPTVNQTSTHYLSDLWVYGTFSSDQNPSWKLIYRESGGESPSSSHPENFPLLCRSERSGNLALFGSQQTKTMGTESHSSMFSEDGVVWLYDIPKNFEKIPTKSGGSCCNWSSYICCDVCVPDDSNVPLETCPQFNSGEPMWCNEDSLFQLSLSTSQGVKGKQPTSQTSSSSSTFLPKNEIPGESKQGSNTVGDSADSANIAGKKESLMKNGSNSQGVGQQQWNEAEMRIGGKSPKQNTSSARIESRRQEGTKDEMNNNELKTEINTSKVLNSQTANVQEDVVAGRAEANFWKFDLISREWAKMPSVKISKESADHIRNESCRTVSDRDFLYILCPTKKNLLDRYVYLFDQRKRSIDFIGSIQLNNAFHDKKVWHFERSVMHALRADNQTFIFLAYQKLLDLYIFDHSSKRLFSVENVWKGSAMYAFQHTSSFYKLQLKIVLPSSSSFTTDNNGQRATSAREERTYSFYMANPRSKLFTFEDPFPDGHFLITIVESSAVFLPSRDARYLINSTDSNHKSVYNPESPAPAFKAVTARALTTNASTIKYDQDSTPGAPLLMVSQAHINGKIPRKGGFPLKESSVAEEMTKATVTGLGKVHDSSYISTQATFRTSSVDSFTASTRGDAGTGISDAPVVALASQLKSNATRRNYNKPNNSSFPRVELTPGLKKRILGIKRTGSETKIDPGSASQMAKSSIISTSSPSPNTIRYKTGHSSLQVNNESNRKPLSTSSESSPANSTSMPRVMKVLNENPATHRIGPEKGAFPYRNKSIPAGTTEAKSDEVNLSVSPQVSALRVAALEPLRPESLPATLGTKIDQANIWIKPKNSSSILAYTRSRQEADENYNLDDHPNSENNYVPRPKSESSSRGPDLPKKNETLEMNVHYNESFVGDMDTNLNPLTYGSSEILIDSPNDDIQSIGAQDGSTSSYSSLGSLLFFSLSLSLFAGFGLVLFFRRCVKCPPTRDESVLLNLKEPPPPIHYAAIPDELSFHMPIV